MTEILLAFGASELGIKIHDAGVQSGVGFFCSQVLAIVDNVIIFEWDFFQVDSLSAGICVGGRYVRGN